MTLLRGSPVFTYRLPVPTFRRLVIAVCVSVFIFCASCSSERQTLSWAERQRLVATYYDRLTPLQRSEFLSHQFESSQAAEAALNAYAQRNANQAQLLQRRTEQLGEITHAWQAADRFVESVNAYLSERKTSKDDSTQRSELNKQYTEVITQLANVETAIRHTPFESNEKIELLQKNSSYRERVEEAKKNLSGK